MAQQEGSEEANLLKRCLILTASMVLACCQSLRIRMVIWQNTYKQTHHSLWPCKAPRPSQFHGCASIVSFSLAFVLSSGNFHVHVQ